MGALGQLLADEGDVAGAKSAYQQAINTGHPEVAPRAKGLLGTLLAKEGDISGAKAAFQQIIDSGHELAPLAMVDLGRLLAEQGDVAGAKAAYQQALDSGDSEVAAMARRMLQRAGESGFQRRGRWWMGRTTSTSVKRA
jgi:predicted negative regulator of RcsB-dependent stress response